MRKFLLALCCSVTFYGSVAAQDVLEPAASFYDTLESQEYQSIIRDSLIPAKTDRFTSRYWVIPYFGKEYFLGTKKEGKDFFVVYREPEMQIRYNMDLSSGNPQDHYVPKIEETKRRIAHKDAMLLDSLVMTAVQNARFATATVSFSDSSTATGGPVTLSDEVVIVNGPTYFFSTAKLSTPATAYIRSCRSSSATGELVTLFGEVVAIVKNGSGTVAFTDEFRARIIGLAVRFTPFTKQKGQWEEK